VSEETETFDARLAALETFVAALQAGELELGAAMREFRDRWRPTIAALEAELSEFRQELEQDGVDSTERRDLPENSDGSLE
jgi:exonuclease VII small subunit